MKMVSFLLTILFCFATSVSAQQAQENLTAKTEAIPKIFQVSPADSTSLVASRWMAFSNCNGEKACCDILIGTPSKKGASLTYKSGIAPSFTAVDGMVLEVPTENAYSVLITWTLRVEGESGKAINPWRNLCGSWHGSITETFKGGDVYSQAYVDYNDGRGLHGVGPIAGMTIPDGGSITANYPHDPTHSGSCLIKASDKDVPDGKFPAKTKIQIFWKNDTSLDVTSKANYRSLIVTVLPVGSNG
ncbi:MAG: hypothetical protein WC417_07170 [Candidatus Omnitrophota bacterium]|jgi:hypothetical protein